LKEFPTVPDRQWWQVSGAVRAEPAGIFESDDQPMVRRFVVMLRWAAGKRSARETGGVPQRERGRVAQRGPGAACSVAAWRPTGEWTIYRAEVETWDERRISRPMWTVSAGGGRWGVDSPEGDILRRPNVTIQVDGRLTPA
jgi:hypothetical protein